MHLQAHPWWPEWCIDALILRSNHLHHMSISEYICIYYQSDACDASWNFFAIHLGEIFKPPRRQFARTQVRNVTDKGPRFDGTSRIEMPRNISNSARMINVGQIEDPPTEMHQLKLSNIYFLGNEKGCTKTWVHTTSSMLFLLDGDVVMMLTMMTVSVVQTQWAVVGQRGGLTLAVAQH